jgi:hypothetical protein
MADDRPGTIHAQRLFTARQERRTANMQPQESNLRTLRTHLANLHNTLQLSRTRLQSEATATNHPPPSGEADHPGEPDPALELGQHLLNPTDVQRGEQLLNYTFRHLERFEELAGLRGADGALRHELENGEILEMLIEVVMRGNEALERVFEEREIRHPLLATTAAAGGGTTGGEGSGRRGIGRTGGTRNTGGAEVHSEDALEEGVGTEESVEVAMADDSGPAAEESTPMDDGEGDDGDIDSPTANWVNQFISDNIDRLGLRAALTDTGSPMTGAQNNTPMTQVNDPTPPTTSSSSDVPTPATPTTPVTPGSGTIMGLDDEMREARNRRWEELRRRLSRQER